MMNLATIPLGVPFLDALATWWLGQAGPDPLAVSDALFLLPTRRAARGLAEAFLRCSDGRPLLLPRIVPFGGLDDAPLAMAGALTIPPAVAPADRLAALTAMILRMDGSNGAPREADRAWTLAVELAALLDEAARADVDLPSMLPDAAGKDWAEHWNVTLKFLEIVTLAWPAVLAAAGKTDIAGRQIELLKAQTAAWEQAPPSGRVIAAGTTGAIPAVAGLLRAVARMKNGLVVLPGLDPDLDDASWEALDDTHPQANLRTLLARLDATRGDAVLLQPLASCSPAGRLDTLRAALLPAASLHRWQDATSDLAPSLDGVQRLEPADAQEEAQAIALVLRQALETPETRAALVTPDRQLAQRVAAELWRFGIVADDSAGERLAETPPAVFLRLLAQAVVEDLRPVPLLALLKHPFAAAGMAPADCRAAARTLERACLRGPRPGPGIEGLRRRRGDATFLDRVAACLRPLLDLAAQPAAAAGRLLAALTEAAEALAATAEAPGSAILWAGEDGSALAAHLASLAGALAGLPPQRPQILPGLLEATLGEAAVRSRRALHGRDGALHPRIFIWGLLEARLQSAELIVLGGLTEGVWPQASDPGPWLSRAMRTTVGLPSPEEQVGLAAHDFVSAICSAPTVILSSPRRRGDAPCVPSRWLVRLDALLEGAKRHLPIHPAVRWSQALDRPGCPAIPVRPPAPCPPVARRPRRLSVTEIETWLRDPYAIYARHVLALRKLDPLEQSADAADYGRIVHDGMNRFLKRFGTTWPAAAETQLTADMDAALTEMDMRPALAAWWRPRLHRIATWVADAEAARRAAGPLARIDPEVKGAWTFDCPAGPFTLHGRADRIESRGNGTIAILDYKTGTPPTTADVRDGLAPQLPLEGEMVAQGAFPDLAGPVVELTYWHISGGHDAGKAAPLFRSNEAETQAAIERAAEGLRRLVANFDDPARAYLSQPSPGAAPRFSDYAQLARVAEWAAAEE